MSRRQFLLLLPRLISLFLLGGGLILPSACFAEASSSAEDIQNVPNFGVVPREHDLAIVVGVEKYALELPQAEYAVNDATLVRNYLVALGFPPRNIDFLTNERASGTLIRKAVRDLPNRTKPDSRLFLYYSGHGSPDATSGEAYLVPFDGDPDDLSHTAYSLKELYQQLGKLEVKEIIVVLDSCFSGRGGRSVLAKARPLVTMVQSVALASPLMAVLSSTKGDQISITNPDKKHGIFTYYFLKAIQEGKSGLANIYAEIKDKVEDESKSLKGFLQSPTLQPGPEKAKTMFAFDLHPHQQATQPSDNQSEAQRQKLEEQIRRQQAQLDEQQRKFDEQQREQQRRFQEMEERIKQRESQLDQEAQSKAQERQRRMEQEQRRKLEQQKEELDRKQLELMRKKQELEFKKDEPVFIPPTF